MQRSLASAIVPGIVEAQLHVCLTPAKTCTCLKRTVSITAHTLMHADYGASCPNNGLEASKEAGQGLMNHHLGSTFSSPCIRREKYEDMLLVMLP